MERARALRWQGGALVQLHEVLRDLDGLLQARPLDLTVVHEALRRVPVIEPVDKRVSAAIIGVPQ